jgi:hypothetical protein
MVPVFGIHNKELQTDSVWMVIATTTSVGDGIIRGSSHHPTLLPRVHRSPSELPGSLRHHAVGVTKGLLLREFPT